MKNATSRLAAMPNQLLKTLRAIPDAEKCAFSSLGGASAPELGPLVTIIGKSKTPPHHRALGMRV
jgi:hypothetical protein